MASNEISFPTWRTSYVKVTEVHAVEKKSPPCWVSEAKYV